MASARRRTPAANPVRDAVARLGGVIEVCAILRVSNRTLFRWMRRGVVADAAPALRLAEALGGSAAEQLARARRLAGLES